MIGLRRIIPLLSFLFCLIEGSKSRLNNKRSKTSDEIQPGEIVEVLEDKKRPRLTEDFSFNFFQEDLSFEQEFKNIKAVNAFMDCDENVIDELMVEKYDIFANGIWDELTSRKQYKSIKYILTNHLNDHNNVRKMFKLAISQGLTSLFKFILSNFGHFVRSDHCQFVIAAFENEKYRILRKLARVGFDMNVSVDYNGNYLLHVAVINENIQLVKALLQSDRINLNIRDCDRNTPLHLSKSADITKLLIRKGVSTLFKNRFGNIPIDVAIKSQRYDLVTAFSPSLKGRLEHFIKIMEPKNYIPKSGTFVIDRQRVLEDSFYLANRVSYWFMVNSDISIKFKRETGVDMGGLSREWYSLLISRLFVPRLQEDGVVEKAQFVGRTVPADFTDIYYGAPFECVDEENKMYKISSTFTGPVRIYKFIGSIVAKALLRRIPLQVKLVPSLIKLILGEALTFEDLKDHDRVMYRSMQCCLKDNFNLEAAKYTMPSDDSVAVDRGNIREFLNETAVEVMYERQKEAIDGFLSGFHSILKPKKLKPYFSPSDLQDILEGSVTINRKEFFECIEIRGSYWINNLQMFWDGIKELSDQELIELVKFITGINGLPYGGVSTLKKTFNVFNETDRDVIRSSTCSFAIYLPVTIKDAKELTEMFRIGIASDPEFSDGCH